MRLRNRWARWTSIAVLVAAVSLLAAACGGGGNKSSASTTTTTSSGGSSQQKTFSNLTLAYDTGIDYAEDAPLPLGEADAVWVSERAAAWRRARGT